MNLPASAVSASSYLSIVCLVLSNPAVEIPMSKLLGMINILTIILHLVLLTLNYPANLENFFKSLFPLVTFNALPTT